MGRRTFLLRGLAALATAAFAAVRPKAAGAVPAPPTVPPEEPWVYLRTAPPPLLHRYLDAYGVEHVDVVPEGHRGGLTLMQTAIRRDGVPTDAERATVALFTNDSPVIRVLGGGFTLDGPIPRPRRPSYLPWKLRQARLQGPARRRLLHGR